MSQCHDGDLLNRWMLKFGSTGHPIFYLNYRGELPSSGSSEWYHECAGAWETRPIPIDITFTSEADAQPELALRKVCRTHCHGLPRIDMFGWLVDRVPAQ